MNHVLGCDKNYIAKCIFYNLPDPEVKQKIRGSLVYFRWDDFKIANIWDFKHSAPVRCIR